MRSGAGALIERAWYGTDAVARALRALLTPFAAAYGGAMRLRGALYDVGALPTRALALPAVSIGNLTVGGTGKTPVAAWFAAQLAAQGARPAIVLRGYGEDEPLVHRELNPGIPVIASSDRVDGVLRAAAMGATVAVLDDAFQHRRARRDVDVVLVNADRWGASRRPLPAGPWREPLGALARGTLALVTRRAVSRAEADAVAAELVRVAPRVRVAVGVLALGDLHRVDENERRPLTALSGARVYAVAGIGDPRALDAQLGAAGAAVTMRAYPDHHAFTAADAAEIARAARDSDIVLCTLKDAVKLRPLWTRALPPLWYVSQQFGVESGAPTMHALLTLLSGAVVDSSGPVVRPAPMPPTDS